MQFKFDNSLLQKNIYNVDEIDIKVKDIKDTYLDLTAKNIMKGSIKFTTDNTYDIATASQRVKNIFAVNIGSATKRIEHIYVDSIHTDESKQGGLASNGAQGLKIEAAGNNAPLELAANGNVNISGSNTNITSPVTSINSTTKVDITTPTLTVSGDTKINKTLTVTGATTLNNKLTVNSDITSSGKMTATTFAAKDANVKDITLGANASTSVTITGGTPIQRGVRVFFKDTVSESKTNGQWCNAEGFVDIGYTDTTVELTNYSNSSVTLKVVYH